MDNITKISYIMITVLLFLLIVLVTTNSSTIRLAIMVFVFIVIIIIAIYTFNKTPKQLGAKTKKKITNEKLYKIYYRYRVNWIKNYLYVFVLLIVLMILMPYFKHFHSKSLYYILGISVGLISFLGVYKRHPWVMNLPRYKYLADIGHEKTARIFYLIISLVLIVLGIIGIIFF